MTPEPLMPATSSLQVPELTRQMVEALAGGRVLIIGDLMLDSYLIGDAERISPEAPVPVVRVEEQFHLLGGAGNVACTVAALGGKASIIGVTGKDAAADDLTRLLQAQGIRPVLTQLEDRCTTVKTRVMARRQQMLRLDHESQIPLSAEDMANVMQTIREEAIGHQVIVLSDYAKGLMGPDFAQGLAGILGSLPHHVEVLVDPKPQHFSCFSGATIMTPNLKETGEGAGMPVRTEEEIVAAGRAILQRVGCKHLLSTLGAQGMALFCNADEVWHIPTVARDVFDVTGAGDTVIGTLGLAMATGHGVLAASMLANYAAGVVVGKVGAATVSPEELWQAVQRGPQGIGAWAVSRWA